MISGVYSLAVVLGVLVVAASLVAEMGSRHVGFRSCSCELSRCGSQASEHRLSSSGAWGSCSAARGIFPDQEEKLMSPALAGGFFPTEPPLSPQIAFLA